MRVFSPRKRLKANITIKDSMLDVIIAMIPVCLVSLYFYGINFAIVLAAAVAASLATETVVRMLLGKKNRIVDLSAVVTGMLIALVLPSSATAWRAAIAAVIGVGLAKELMGGLGWNRFNPALFGYVVTMIFGSTFRVNQPHLLAEIDVITQATPLTMIHQGVQMPGYGSLLLAFPGGSFGEASALALILGGVYLLYQRQIEWRMPVSIISTVFLGSMLFGIDPIYSVLSGGVLLGAIFMATDWVTCPDNLRGKILHGICIGVLICIFRYALPTTGGVAFSILIMNPIVPVIEKLTVKKRAVVSNQI
ncbi:electron transport complex protein RnfD [Natronincola peptidivorans]|uniref:Electron transport complex protein RnfD n=1 Tax=Natronincola peptidivorans TaxID=426128 RepID=A0A1I0BKZ0_9FIRM|nr:RnfABCDGE type electron transport complex subunit D [Natronincola peptidivorans]SET07599.1 electron transport complex protein RnfD [Natronincola peptidivorans]